MSHFYNRKSYTFGETDEMLFDLRKEMSNFITKEEAELILNRRNAMIDPPPAYYHDSKYKELLYEICNMREQIYEMAKEIDRLKLVKEYDEPTM